MKILSAEQIKECDAFTISHEPVSSIDLMERAAATCLRYILKRKPDSEFVVICGKGNNGGDGLAITRMLLARGVSAQAWIVDHTEHESEDFKTNFQRLNEVKPEAIKVIKKNDDFQTSNLNASHCIIDSLFGTGLNKRVAGICADTIDFINTSNCAVISIDVPSGLLTDQSNQDDDKIVRSSLTLTFQVPKLSFLMPQNSSFVPEFEILDIGLSDEFIQSVKTSNYFLEKKNIQSLITPRQKFSHKGIFGHAMLLAGSFGKMGAAVIASKAVLRSGAGLLTTHVPKKGADILQVSIPEAMLSVDDDENLISDLPKLDKFNAIGIGPGIGTAEQTQTVLKKLLQYSALPMVIDADGLNILSENKTWLSFLPEGTILTPHVKEFDRLTEKHTNDFDRLSNAKNFSLKYNCIIVLKGAYTQIIMPDGSVFFNSTGNPGLAKGGSGDALTGIILGLLARGYNPPKSALIGTYVHGLAADLCLKKIHMESLLATDVIAKLPKAFEKLYDV
jgi:NAD(P)H-hydrate epimerase